MMKFEEYKKKILKERPQVRSEYDRLEPEFQKIRQSLDECMNVVNSKSENHGNH